MVLLRGEGGGTRQTAEDAHHEHEQAKETLRRRLYTHLSDQSATQCVLAVAAVAAVAAVVDVAVVVAFVSVAVVVFVASVSVVSVFVFVAVIVVFVSVDVVSIFVVSVSLGLEDDFQVRCCCA